MTRSMPPATAAPVACAMDRPRVAPNRKTDLLRLCARIGYTPH